MAVFIDDGEGMEDPVVDISSLIDVSFLLLIYFLVSSTIATEDKELRMALPSVKESNSNAPAPDTMSLRIAADGGIFIVNQQFEPAGGDNNVPTLLEELRRFKSIADATSKPAIVGINADNQSQYQRFVDVMNALSKVNISDVTLTGFVD